MHLMDANQMMSYTHICLFDFKWLNAMAKNLWKLPQGASLSEHVNKVIQNGKFIVIQSRQYNQLSVCPSFKAAALCTCITVLK
jgi:hypothetical protein